MKKPNIILFVPDTYRGDALAHMGNKAAITPNFDAFLQESASFNSAYCQNTICTPSRCSFMSGHYPHVNGHRTLTNMMEYYEPVLLEYLKKEGYHIFWGGKDDLIPGENSLERYCDELHIEKDHPVSNTHGDQSWRSSSQDDDYYSFLAGKLKPTVGDRYYCTDWSVTDGVVRFLENYDEEKPFCLYLPLNFPHPPYGVEDPWYSMIDRSLIDMPIPAFKNWENVPSMIKGIYERQRLQGMSEEKWIEIQAVYLAMCARTDAQFGIIMEKLKEKEMYDDSAVFFFSDHGDFTGQYGLVEKAQNVFTDCLSRVPLMIKPPKNRKVKPGINEALVELVDIVPTVCDYAGIELDYDHFGVSLADCVAGKQHHRDAVFCEGGRRHGEIQCMESADPRFVEPSGLYYPKVATQMQEGPEHTKAVMCRTKEYKYVYRLYENDEFYDMVNDPGETINLIDSPKYKQEIERLKNRVLYFMVETCDTVPRKENSRFRPGQE